jgi:hypothetical protein
MPITKEKEKIRVQQFNGGEDSTGEKGIIQTPFCTLARNVLLDEPGKSIQRPGLVRTGDNPDTLISYYSFDASDVTDNKTTNDGTDTSVTYVDGKFGKAAKFNGTTSLITIPANSTIDITSMGAFVITCWLAPDSDGQSDVGRVWTKGEHYAKVFGESGNTVKLEFVVDYGAGTDAKVITSTTIPSDEDNPIYTKVEFHYNADESLDIYVNGAVAIYTTDTTGSGTVYDDSSDDLIIGNVAAATATFDGVIDDFRIYDGARTSDEYEQDKIFGLSRFKVGDTIDKLYRIRDVHLEALATTFKSWGNIVNGFTADKHTNFIQANDELWILNGVDRPHVITSNETLLKKINTIQMTIGTGLDDATEGGTFTGTADATYEVEIDSMAPPPDSFKWRKDGGAYTELVSITGSAQTLSDGVTITFAATTGHDLGDEWTIYAFPDEGKGLELGEASGDKDNPPNCTLGAWAQNNRMFMSGHLTDSLRDYVWFSNTLNAHAWNTTIGTGNFFRVQSGKGGKVTWLQPFKLNELIVYKENSIWVLDMTGATPLTDWSLQPLNILIGCKAGRTVKDIGNDQIFLDHEGFVRLLSRTSFDKLKTSVISGPVQDILDDINVDSMNKACAELINGVYFLSFPSGNSTENNTVLMWDSTAAQRLNQPSSGWSVIPLNTWNAGYLSIHEFGDNQQSLVVADNRTLSLTYQHTGDTDNGTTIQMEVAGPQHVGRDRGSDKVWGPLYAVSEAGVATNMEFFADINSSGFRSLGTLSLLGGAPVLPIDLPFNLGSSDKSESLFHVKYIGRGKTCVIKARHSTYNVNVNFNEYELHWEERITRE